MPPKTNTLLFRILPLTALAAIGAAVFFSAGRLAPAGDNNFFTQFVKSGGPIVWFVLIPLSIVTLFIMLNCIFMLRQKNLVPKGQALKIVYCARASGASALRNDLAENSDLVSTAVDTALQNSGTDWFAFKNSMTESLNDQAVRLLRRIEWLNLIGGIAPMIGLFGTVFGMIKLFNAIVAAGGQPQPANLAGGISVSLVTTLWGLFIAIPAIAAHGIFRSRIESLAGEALEQIENAMNDLRKILFTRPVTSSTPKIAIRQVNRTQSEPMQKNVRQL